MVKKKNRMNGSYKPTEKEDFMNPKQLEYFKNLLNEWKTDLLAGSSTTINKTFFLSLPILLSQPNNITTKKIVKKYLIIDQSCFYF